MEKKAFDIKVAVTIFVMVIIIGTIYVDQTSMGYIEGAMVYLASVIAVGCYWIGACIRNER